MPPHHTIRLRGPWEYEPLVRSRPGTPAAELPAGGRVDPPADWGATLGDDYRGTVRYRRRFGRPEGVEPHERVWIVVEPVRDLGAVSLNGRSLGPVGGPAAEPARFDVTRLLDPRNELVIDVEQRPEPAGHAPSPPGGLVGEVRLEIGPAPRAGDAPSTAT